LCFYFKKIRTIKIGGGGGGGVWGGPAYRKCEADFIQRINSSRGESGTPANRESSIL